MSQFAALYASALVPEGARTAASLAPLVTGVGVVWTLLIIAPVAALATDKVLRGQRPLQNVTYITVWQVGARLAGTHLAGTLLAQVILWPAGWVLASMSHWLVN